MTSNNGYDRIETPLIRLREFLLEIRFLPREIKLKAMKTIEEFVNDLQNAETKEDEEDEEDEEDKEKEEDEEDAKKEEAKKIYDYFVIQEWEDKEEGIDGFSLIQNYNLDFTDEMEDNIHNIMFDEFNISYDSGFNNRCCKWVDYVKERANWIKGETIYGFNREKHLAYQISWSRDKKNIGYYTFIIDTDGYISFSLHNGYTKTENNDIKYINYIRPSCLHNDKVCMELNKNIKNVVCK